MTDHQQPTKRRSKFWILIDLLVGAVLLACIVATIAGFAGRNDWRFDLFSHFRIQYAIACLPAVLWFAIRRKPILFFIGLTGVAINGWLVSPLLMVKADGTAIGKTADGDSDDSATSEADQSDVATLRILMSNVYVGNSQTESLMDQIAAEDPDIIIIEEYTDELGKALAGLKDSYPYSVKESNDGAFGIAMYCKDRPDQMQIWSPPVPPEFVATPAVVARFSGIGRQLTLVATHPVPPTSEEYSSSRNEQLIAIGTLISATPGEVVVCGDLNMTRWSSWFSELTMTGLRDGSEGFGLQTSWPVRYKGLPDASMFRIPIDHCLVSKNVDVANFRVGRDTGSDHLPIVVDLEY